MLALIEMNLLPGGKRAVSGPKKRKRSKPRFEGFGSAFKGDPAVAGVMVLCIGAVALAGYLYFSQMRQLSDLGDKIEVAQEDSARYAKIIAAADSLKARQDTLLQKIDIIREIDSDRYIWTHLMDEVSRALPDFTWLTGLQQVGAGDPDLRFRIQGMTGTNFALTRFMRTLEDSPFIDRVEVVSSEPVQQQRKVVHSFVLEARYQEPDSSVINTEPIILAGE